ncbi:MAG: response regulator [Betaproteobacteria bacterium]
MLPRVFELFVQADHASTNAQGGLGVGLTLVKKLVEMHHGTVDAYSNGLGKGSEFVCRLPLLPPDESQIVKTKNGDQRQAALGHRLLVVDDNQDAAISLAMLLRLLGHEVWIAHNGTDALELAATHRPDMIFLDIGMPVMDGYEAARRLRQQPELKNTVLAALTGWDQQESRRRAADAGFDHHLVKPLEPKVLEGLLAKLSSPSN